MICVGSGNEGTTAGHAAGEYRKGMMTEVQLAVQQRRSHSVCKFGNPMSMKSQLQLSIHPEIIPADWKKKKEHKDYRLVKQNSWFTMESQNHIVFARKFILVFYHEMNLSQPECGK